LNSPAKPPIDDRISGRSVERVISRISSTKPSS
jgi:hypothetical protein